jgi:AsmA protein
MSFFAKVGLFIVGVIIVGVIALTVFIKTQVTPDKVRSTVLPLVEEQLQRKTDFGDIHIGFFSGITIADFQVKEKNSDEDFISLKKLTFRYRLWPLFKGQIAIDQVLLVEPQINVVRNHAGLFNFSDLIDKGASQNSSSEDEKKVKISNSSRLIDLLVKEVSIDNGTIHFVDEFINPKSPYRYNLEQMNFSAHDITLDESFPLDLSVVVNGSALSVLGNYNIADQSCDLILDLKPLDIVQFAPYYRDSLPGKLGAALVSMNLEVALKQGQIHSKGQLLLNDVDLVMDALKQAPLKQVDLRTDYAIEFDLNDKHLEVSTLLVDFNGLLAKLEGQIALASDDPTLDFGLKLEQLDLRQVFERVPEALIEKYKSYSPAGSVDVNVRLAGSLSQGPKLLQNAYIKLNDVAATVATLRTGISGELLYHDALMTSNDLVVTLGEQKLGLDLEAHDLFADVVHGEFGMTATELDLNRLLAQLSGGVDHASDNLQQESPITTETAATVKEDIGPFNLPLDMKGGLVVDKMLYKRLTLEQVTADMTLKNNYLTVSNLSANVGRGEMRMSSVVNLGIKGLAYQGQMTMQMPDVTTLLSGVIPGMSQQVSGRMAWQNSFSGQGTIPEELLKVLTMQGEVSLSQGTLQDVPLLDNLAVFLGDSVLEALSFDSLSSSYNLRDGLTTLNTELKSSIVQLSPEGTMGLNGGLNLKLPVKLAPKVMERIESRTLQKVLIDEDGWGQLPLKIEGSLTAPKISYDSAALQQQALESAKRKAAEKLEKILPQANDKQEQIEQLLDQTLDKLFGN